MTGRPAAVSLRTAPATGRPPSSFTAAAPPSWKSLAAFGGRAQPEQADDHLVFLLCELSDGATCGFAQDAVDDGLLQVRRDVWRAEDFHHAGQRLHQVIHEVLDSAFAAAEMPL